MGNYNELLTLRNKIENTLNYQLSLSNLELYHSNLFAVVLEKSEFINHKFFSNVIDINKKYTLITRIESIINTVDNKYKQNELRVCRCINS